MITEPENQARHDAILLGLFRKFLTPESASLFRAMSLSMEIERIDLTIRGTVTLTDDEIAAVAIENNRAL